MRYTDVRKNEKKYSLEKISTLLTIVGIIIGAINIYFSNMHAIQCENFYKISRKYFHANFFDSLIPWATYFLLIVAPYLYKTKFLKYINTNINISKKSLINKLFLWLITDGCLLLLYSLAVGFFIFYYSLCILSKELIYYVHPIELSSVARFYTNHQSVLLFVHFALGFLIISPAFFSKYARLIMHNRIVKTIYVLIFLFCFLIIVEGMYIQTSKDVARQQDYEKIHNANYLVLSDVNSSQKLIAPYYKESGEYSIDTSSYRIINSDSYSYTFISFPKAPTVKERNLFRP